MRIIIVDPSRPDTAQLRRVLEANGHTVQSFVDPKEAYSSMVDGHADVALVEWNLGTTKGAELIQRVRADEKDGYLYILAMLGRDAAPQPDAIFAAGADDFVRKLGPQGELVARVLGADRLRRVARVVVDREERRRAATPSSDAIVSLGAWARLPEVLHQALGDFLGAPVDVGEPGTVVRSELAVSIPFSLPSETTELRFYLDTDKRAIEAVGETLFGEPVTSEAALTDIFLEMTNQVAGAFMRIAAEENVPFTTGLPVAVAPSELLGALGNAETYKRVVFEVPGAKAPIRITAVVRRRQNVRVPVTRLREGMILVSDVHGPNGALLIRGGTRITSSACARIVEVLGEASVVEVADAA